MTRAIIFEARREEYSIEDVRKPITVEQLKRMLDEYDDDDMIIISHDNGYTYGSLRYDREEWLDKE